MYRVSHVGAIGSPRLRVACMQRKSLSLTSGGIDPSAQGCEVSREWLLPFLPLSLPHPSSSSLPGKNKVRQGPRTLFRSPCEPIINFWSAPTVIRVRHSRRLAFVPLSWYRPDTTGDLDSLAEEIYPTFDSRSSACSARPFVRSLVTARPAPNR